MGAVAPANSFLERRTISCGGKSDTHAGLRKSTAHFEVIAPRKIQLATRLGCITPPGNEEVIGRVAVFVVSRPIFERGYISGHCSTGGIHQVATNLAAGVGDPVGHCFRPGVQQDAGRFAGARGQRNNTGGQRLQLAGFAVDEADTGGLAVRVDVD